MPPDAILCGLLLVISFMSHCVISVPGTVWVEPVILWIAITIPTGSVVVVRLLYSHFSPTYSMMFVKKKKKNLKL